MSRLQADPDRVEGAPLAGRLHLRLGRLLIGAVNLIRPRVTLGARLVAFDTEGRVFLIRQTYMPGFHLPGGGVSPGETCRQAAMREAWEEGGLRCPTPPDLFGIYLNRALAGRDHVALFVARDSERESRSSRGLEVCEAGFYPPDALPDTTTPATKARIAEVLAGRQASDIW